MLGLTILLAGSLLLNRAEFPDPCDVQGQEFYGFVGGDDEQKQRIWRDMLVKDVVFFGATGALAPIAGKNETWVVILPCPFVRGQVSFSSLFRDRNSAQESLPTLFERYLFMKNVRREREANARGRGSYNPVNSGMSLLEPIEGSLYSYTQISETAGSCFCRKEKG